MKKDFHFFVFGFLLVLIFNFLFYYVCALFYSSTVVGILWIVVGSIIMLSSMTLLTLTNVTDPGTLAKNTDDDPRLAGVDGQVGDADQLPQLTVLEPAEHRDKRDSSTTIEMNPLRDSSDKSISVHLLDPRLPTNYPFIYTNTADPLTRQVVVNNIVINCRYCTTCKAWRPPRASHCSDCDSCILNHDHHCPWMGNCVGKYNYAYFFWFLVAVCLNCVYICGSIIYYLVIEGWDGGVLAVSVLIFTALIFVSLAGLLCYHFWLVWVNLTTHEQVGLKYPNGNPFNVGWMANCKRVSLW